MSVAGSVAQIGVDGIIDDRNDDVGAAKLSSVRWPLTTQSAAKQSAPAYCPGCRQLLPLPNKERGEVKWYHRRKGYGFITRQGGPDLYVHRSAVQRSKAYGSYLKWGDLVEFTLGENRHGSVASKVKVLDRSADSP